MSIEVGSSNVVCCKCGHSYGRRKGYFPVSYSTLYKGIGYIPYCKDCIDVMYNKYLSICGDAKDAVRQVCRKLDLYWSDSVYEFVERKNTTRSMMTGYIARVNTVTYAGKCYDDTLESEGTLWGWTENNSVSLKQTETTIPDISKSDNDDLSQIPQEVINFWGSGYTASMYTELEQRYAYWLENLPKDLDFDVGTTAIIRQICSLELDINRDRAAGKPVDKNVNALNSLLGSANLKPSQQRTEDIDATLTNTPLGVWLYRYENKRPLPEIDEELKDVNGIIRYILIWVRGHLAKMMGLKNSYSKMYEDEMARLRVEKPEYDEDDDEEFLNKVFADSSEGEPDE